MVSTSPNTLAHNFTHLFGPSQKENLFVIDPRSITGILKNEQRFSKFYRILQISGLEKRFAEPNSELQYTLFAPDNNSSFIASRVEYIENISVGVAVMIIKSCIVNNTINYELLKNSDGLRLNTANLLIKLDIDVKNDEVFINNKIKIKNIEHVASNGIIQEVSELIDPYFFRSY